MAKARRRGAGTAPKRKTVAAAKTASGKTRRTGAGRAPRPDSLDVLLAKRFPNPREAALWRRQLKRPSIASRNALAEFYMPWVKAIVPSLRARYSLPDGVAGIGEILSAASQALLESIPHYQPDRNTSFRTFATYRIRGAVVDWLRRVDPMPRLARTRAKVRAAAVHRIIQELGRVPTDDEIAEQLGITLSELEATREREVESLHAEICDSERRKATYLVDTLCCGEWPAKRDDLGGLFEVNGPMRCLGTPQYLVLCLNFQYGHPLNRIAEILRVSETRVSQLRADALRQMQARLVSRWKAAEILSGE